MIAGNSYRRVPENRSSRPSVNLLSSINPTQEPLRGSDYLGDAALYILCLSAFGAPALADVATALLVIAFLAAAPRARVLLREPVVLLALAGTAYGLVHTLVAGLLSPQHAGLYWEGLTSWLKLLLFIPVAFFSRGEERKLDLLLLLLLAGLLFRILFRMDWTTLIADPGEILNLRPGFGLPALAFALYSGAGLIGLATVGRRLLEGEPGSQTRNPLAPAFWAFAACILLLGLSLAAARSGWLALLVAMPVALWVSRGRQPPAEAQVETRRWLKLAVGLTVAAVVVIGSQRTFERAAWELNALTASPPGPEQTPLTSDRVRLNGLRFGVETWMERPWFGWGADASGHLLGSADPAGLRFHDGARLEHLHNTYLEILVQFGAVGLFLVAALLLALAQGLRLACRDGRSSSRYCGFFLGVLVMVLIWSLFEYRLPHRDWRVFWMVVGGAAYGHLLLRLPGLMPRDATPSETPGTGISARRPARAGARHESA